MHEADGASSARPRSSTSAARSSGDPPLPRGATPGSSSASASAGWPTVIDRDAEAVDAASSRRPSPAGRPRRACVAHPQEGTILTVADAGAAAASRPRMPVARSPTSARRPSTRPRRPSPAPRPARGTRPRRGRRRRRRGLRAHARVASTGWSPATGPRRGLLPPGRPCTAATSGHERRCRRHPVAAPRAGRPCPSREAGATTRSTTGRALGSGPAYEVMYLLTDATAEAVEPLRARSTSSATRCSSSAARTCGTSTSTSTTRARRSRPASPRRPERIRSPTSRPRSVARAARSPLGVVACAAGPGIGGAPRGRGAVVVAVGTGRRASRPAARRGAGGTGSRCVVLLPGDRDTLMAAEVARGGARRGRRRPRGPGAHHGPGDRRPRGARPRPVGARQRGRDDGAAVSTATGRCRSRPSRR